MIRPENLECLRRELAAQYNAQGVDGARPASAAGLASVRLATATAKQPLVTAAWPGSRWTLDTAGKVCNGRDLWATILIWLAFRAGLATVKAITDQAWSIFQRTAELDRPRKNGQRPWRRADLLKKARYLLGPRKSQIGRAVPSADGFWTPALRAAFCDTVNRCGAQGRLAPAAVRVSHAMAGYVRGDGSCFTSPLTLAHELGLAERTVKQARCRLVEAKLWRVANNRGGRARGADYTPNPEVLFEDDPTATRLAHPSRKGERSGHPNPKVGEGTLQEEPREASPARHSVSTRTKRKNSYNCDSVAASAPASMGDRRHSPGHDSDLRDPSPDNAFNGERDA